MRCLLYFLVVGLFGWWGCSDDSEQLTPSDIAEYEIKIPQGNHEYDDRIVDWFDRTGIYILYKYSDAEIYYDGSNPWPVLYADTTIETALLILGEEYYVKDSIVYNNDWELGHLGITYYEDGTWQELKQEGDKLYYRQSFLAWHGLFQVEEADEAYVGKQLRLLEDLFLHYYTDSILRIAMPLKVLLGKNLRGLNAIQKNYYINFNNLIFNYGSEAIDALTVNQKKTIKLELNYWFLTSRLASMVSFDDFYSVTNYYWAGGSSSSRPSNEQCYGLGLVVRPTYTNLSMIQNNDLKSYLNMIITNSYETLIANPVSSVYDANNFTGILHPDKDKNGLIRRKYDLLINEYKKIGIDLQEIGNEIVGNEKHFNFTN